MTDDMTDDTAAPPTVDRRYVVYLVLIALGGWSLASYDFNLLVLTLPDIAKDMDLSDTFVGLLGFIVYAAMFVITLLVGYGMDTRGRKWMWMFCLSAAAVFTGLTYLVQNYWQLAAVRAVASGFANAELAISITLVNEQVPARRRGLLYSVVQGGWPVGVFLASGVYLLTASHGWRTVYLWGVIPLVMVIVGRIWVRESDRYEHIRDVRRAVRAGDQDRVRELLRRYPVDVGEVGKGLLRELFASPGVVRRNLSIITVVWLLYATSWVATNVYITYWLTHERGWTASQAATLLLVSGGVGFGFYLLGGYLGERYGRRSVLVVSGLVTGPLNLVLLLVHQYAAVAVVYFLVYQATNGTWSGAGYAYWAECFPTRVRGTAIGWLGSMFTGGLIIGSLLWTGLIGVAGAT
ncbi:MAG: MFS transporter, partial [Pseudonocardia sp.]|nr:MFS transporter [Pseudonocardia sp.]